MTTAREAAEAWWYEFLCRKYIQRADEHQKELGLSYTTAETHDLAREIAGALEAKGNE